MACDGFGKAFVQNMNALGLPAPSSLFGTLQAASSNVATMPGALKTPGHDATVSELIGATTALEVLAVVGALSAASYMGACLGSLIVAADAAMKCTSASVATTVLGWAGRNGIVVPAAMLAFIQRHPEVLMDTPSRRSYGFLASRHSAAALGGFSIRLRFC